MRDWLKASASVSLLACCAICFAQQAERQRAVASADRILSTEEFDYSVEESSFFADLLRNFFEWLGGLFGEGSGPSMGGFGQFIGVVLLCGIAVVAVFFVAWLISSRNERNRRLEGFHGEDVRKAPAHELARLSEEAEARGDYSRAFTLAFWAFLKLADKAGIADYSDDSTNWEIVEKIRKESFRADATDHARLFDGIEYGRETANREDVASVRALIGRLAELKVAA